MKIRAIVSLCALTATFALASRATADGEHNKKASANNAGLKLFKQLAGDWVGKMSEDGQNWHDATVKYTVTSGGTAVVETLGAGSPHEMVTIIHQDGKDLALTHYCSIGNQPHMKAKVIEGSNKFDFEFTSASNMASDKDMHMHGVIYTLIDKDTLKAEWASCQDGKVNGHAIFEFKRKK
jgi:hypothetical protein